MMEPGTALASQFRLITAPPMATMAEILRDPNPIHLDPKAVKAAGLGDKVINQGPANMAYILSMVKAALPDYRLVKLESRYLANIRDGDRVEAGGSVVASDGSQLTCETWLRVEGRGDAVVATLVMTPR